MSTITKKTLRVGKYVDSKHVDSTIRTYKKERWVHNSKRIGKEDSLSVWYSIEELEDFIAETKTNGGDGIRCYFGAYGEKDAPKPGFEGRQTIVLVATKSKENEVGITHRDLYINKEGHANILAYNAGSLCPPICPNHTAQQRNAFLNVGLTIVDKGDEGMIVV